MADGRLPMSDTDPDTDTDTAANTRSCAGQLRDNEPTTLAGDALVGWQRLTRLLWASTHDYV